MILDQDPGISGTGSGPSQSQRGEKNTNNKNIYQIIKKNNDAAASGTSSQIGGGGNAAQGVGPNGEIAYTRNPGSATAHNNGGGVSGSTN